MALVSCNIFADSEQVKKYACPKCDHILRDAVQTSCGHWLCQGCAEELFEECTRLFPVCPRPDCGEELTRDGGKMFFPDKFVRKEIRKLSIKCPNHEQGCTWGSTYSELMKHIGECLYVVKRCPHCAIPVANSKYNDHLYDCPKALTTCPFGCKSTEQFTHRQLEKHISDELLQHLLLLGENTKSKAITDKVAAFDGPNNSGKAPSDRLTFDGLASSDRGASRRGDTVVVDGPGMKRNGAITGVQLPSHAASKFELEELRTLVNKKDFMIRKLQEKIDGLEAKLQSKSTENEDQDFRLSLMENSNYDGTMLWKIPQFSQRMEDARTGKYTSIFSLPFNATGSGGAKLFKILTSDGQIICCQCKSVCKYALLTQCGHWLCHNCADKMFKKSSSPKCPYLGCGRERPFGDGKPLLNGSIKCPNSEKGCAWTGLTYDELQQHAPDCQFLLKICPICKQNITALCFEAHEGCHHSEYSWDNALEESASKPGLSQLAMSQAPSAPPVIHMNQFLRESLMQLLMISAGGKSTENEDRDFRLSLMENSNYDGTMLWKIPQFSQRMEDARTGKYMSIFSLPFNSGRNGYKMCLRLYILGDGIGKSTHMSLFFVVMKGEFDNILQWPFTHKVTFKLMNQCGGRDVVDTFQPDPLSSSFQKPKTDMNVASGCPRFISLSELMQGGFIVDDTVFIKVKVDTINMRCS